MASRIPRAVASARCAAAVPSKSPLSRRVAFCASQSALRPQVFGSVSPVQRRYASDKPHYETGPPSINKILEVAEPHTVQEWQEVSQAALEIAQTDEERSAIKEYILNAMKPKLADDEIILLASHSGVALTSPEDLAVGQKFFKNMIDTATTDEVLALFSFFEREGEFPAEIRKEIASSLSSALEAAKTPALSTPAAEHDGHTTGHDDHSHGHGHGGAAKESFGTSWWLTLGAIPFSYIIYLLTRSKDTDNDPFLTRLIRKYDSWKDEYRLTNELHTRLVEQAGYDKLLFNHAADSIGLGTGKKDIRFLDSINQSAPINVSPGSFVNLDKVIENMKQKNEEVEQERVRIEEYLRAREKY